MPLTKVSDRFQKRRERTKQELLQAARRVLASKGYHRSKVSDIAQAANVAVGTVYLYYETKEALFIALVEEVVTLLKARMDAAQFEAKDPAEIVRARNEIFFRFADENRDLFRIVFGQGDPFHEVVRRAQELFISDVAANLHAGMEMGIFRRNNPELLAHAFVGMAAQVLHWWVEQDSAPVDEVSDALIDFVFHGLGLSAAPDQGGEEPSD